MTDLKVRKRTKQSNRQTNPTSNHPNIGNEVLTCCGTITDSTSQKIEWISVLLSTLQWFAPPAVSTNFLSSQVSKIKLSRMKIFCLLAQNELLLWIIYVQYYASPAHHYKFSLSCGVITQTINWCNPCYVTTFL